MLSAVTALLVVTPAGVHTATEVGTIFVASCVGSVVQKLALFPLDTLKTRAQHDRSTRRRLPSSSWSSALSARDIRECVASTPARVRDLYRGITPALLGVIPVSLVYMPVYELASSSAASLLPLAYRPVGRVLAGSLAGLACSVVHVPITVLKNRLQLSQFADLRTAAVAVARAEGIRGFYRGWASEATLEVISATIQFLVLDWLRSLARSLCPPGEQLDLWSTSLIGYVAGSVTALCTEPLDVVRTRLTTQPLTSLGKGGREADRSVAGMLRQIVRTEGPLALWRGLLPRVAYTGLKGAIWYSAYEWARSAIGVALAGTR